MKVWNIVKFILWMLISIAVGGLVLGVVLMYMWNWFIAPLGVTTISFWWALGISLAVGVFTYKGINNGDDNMEDTKPTAIVIKQVGILLAYLAVWGIGAIIHLCM